jgi:hypothetical protein
VTVNAAEVTRSHGLELPFEIELTSLDQLD